MIAKMLRHMHNSIIIYWISTKRMVNPSPIPQHGQTFTSWNIFILQKHDDQLKDAKLKFPATLKSHRNKI